jgi:hypothetical protein
MRDAAAADPARAACLLHHSHPALCFSLFVRCHLLLQCCFIVEQKLTTKPYADTPVSSSSLTTTDELLLLLLPPAAALLLAAPPAACAAAAHSALCRFQSCRVQQAFNGQMQYCVTNSQHTLCSGTKPSLHQSLSQQNHEFLHKQTLLSVGPAETRRLPSSITCGGKHSKITCRLPRQLSCSFPASAPAAGIPCRSRTLPCSASRPLHPLHCTPAAAANSHSCDS